MSTILVADDNDDLRELMIIRLKEFGFSVLAAKNGLEAVQLAKSAHPLVILMDMNMPELDGWEACCQIKRDPLVRSIPIIALTAYSLPGDEARANASGCDGYHAKPVDFQMLLQQIESLAPRSEKL